MRPNIKVLGDGVLVYQSSVITLAEGSKPQICCYSLIASCNVSSLEILSGPAQLVISHIKYNECCLQRDIAKHVKGEAGLLCRPPKHVLPSLVAW